MCSFVCRTPFHDCPPGVTAFEFDLTVITHGWWIGREIRLPFSVKAGRDLPSEKMKLRKSLEGGVRTGQMNVNGDV